MPLRIFGLSITRADSEKEKEQIRSFIAPPNDDGAIEISAVGGAYGTYLDLSGQAKDEAELVTRYRAMERDATVRRAIEDIVNEAIIVSESESPVAIDLGSTDLSTSMKKKIEEEFEVCLKLLDFSNKGYDIFQRWYVDGRIKYHALFDEKAPDQGLKELRYIDPRKIRKIREIQRKKFESDIEGTEKEIRNEYYIFSERGFTNKYKPGDTMYNSSQADIKGIRIAKDSIVDVNSGLFSEDNSLVLSHLDAASKPLNQLQMLENASIIYRLARAPERRVFYIDVGDLPKAKAEQYLHDMMTKHKNKLVYDATTGQIRDDRRFMTMLEDFWLPLREGGRGTEISTLPGASNLGEMDDINYFQGKLYEALNVPSGRLQSDAPFNIGRSSEISRDEVKFAKFILRLRTRFSMLFDEILEKQIILKKIMTLEEWKNVKNEIRYNFIEDNQYQELKHIEIMNTRLEALRNIQDYVGIYYSKEWVRRKILYMLDDEIREMDKQIEKEKAEAPPPEMDGDANDDGFQDRHSSPTFFGDQVDNKGIPSVINMQYVPEPTIEESIDEFLKKKLKLDDEVQ